MPDDGDPELEARAADRLTLFSDAVVAIAITLLAIDLPVPGGTTTSALFSSVRDHWGEYFAFLISFWSISGAWSAHHDVFKSTSRVDPRLRRLDIYWLLTIVLVPFASKLLTSPGHETHTVHALRFGFYALVLAVESALLLTMLRYMTTNRLSIGLPPRVASGATRQATVMMVGFGLSIPVLFLTNYGWLVWIAVPLLSNAWFRSRRRGEEEPDAS